MTEKTHRKARLRTKTGCLTCRSRRKKCDETRPVCHGCELSRNTCQWPSSTDLTDRRHRKRCLGREASTDTILEDTDSPGNISDYGDLTAVRPVPQDWFPTLSEATAMQLVRRDTDALLVNHFADTYYETIVLPDCHADFYVGWTKSIQQIMKDQPALYYAVLACSASQFHSLTQVSQMHDLALNYYSRSMKKVGQLLDRTSVAIDDVLLNSIIFLYLNGCLGLASSDDVPRHVEAAMQILRLRFLDVPSSTRIIRPFERIAVESVLYQIFIVEAGTWQQGPSNFSFDVSFWLQAERLLSRSVLFPDRANSFNSPILGIPLALLRLVLTVKDLFLTPSLKDEESFPLLSEELQRWKTVLLEDEEASKEYFDETLANFSIYKDTALMYFLIASLLLESIPRVDVMGNTSLQLQSTPSWQKQKMVQILQSHCTDHGWSMFFLLCWPVYTVGLFMDTEDERDLVRADLNRRWTVTGSSQVSRFLNELEAAWVLPHEHGMIAETWMTDSGQLLHEDIVSLGRSNEFESRPTTPTGTRSHAF